MSIGSEYGMEEMLPYFNLAIFLPSFAISFHLSI
jgi:hypothetical protein